MVANPHHIKTVSHGGSGEMTHLSHSTLISAMPSRFPYLLSGLSLNMLICLFDWMGRDFLGPTNFLGYDFKKGLGKSVN